MIYNYGLFLHQAVQQIISASQWTLTHEVVSIYKIWTHVQRYNCNEWAKLIFHKFLTFSWISISINLKMYICYVCIHAHKLNSEISLNAGWKER